MTDIREERAEIKKKAEAVVEAIAGGDGSRNRLRELWEGISKSGAMTVEGLSRQMAEGLSKSSGWSDVYAGHEREIRVFLRGSIGKLQESIPSKRFRVLGTKHAPKNPERYRRDVISSFEEVLSGYESVAESVKTLDNAHEDGSNQYVNVPDGVTAQVLQGFAGSLAEGAATVADNGRKILALEGGRGELNKLARLHDMLADGLEDFTIGAAFITKIGREAAKEESRT